jgi:hypothetical protein
MKRLLFALFVVAAAVAGTAWWLRPHSASAHPAGSASPQRVPIPAAVPHKSTSPPPAVGPSGSANVTQRHPRNTAVPSSSPASNPVSSGEALTSGTNAPLTQASLSLRPSGYSKIPRATRRGTVPQDITSPPAPGERSGADSPDPPELTVPFSLTNPGQPAAIPAALTLTSGGGGFTEVEKDGIDQLAADFLEQISGGSQDPHDPAYQKLWTEAAALSDARLRSRFGGETWLRQHTEAYRQALGNNPPDQAGP